MKKFSLLTLVVLFSGCAANVQTNSTQQGPKESAGAISGMIIGGALANAIKQLFADVHAATWDWGQDINPCCVGCILDCDSAEHDYVERSDVTTTNTGACDELYDAEAS